MPRFASVDLRKSAGFDEDRQLLTIQAGKTAQLYLVAGDNLDVISDDPEICKVLKAVDKDVAAAHRHVPLSAGEKGSSIRIVSVQAGAAVGTTQLRGAFEGVGWAGPVTVQVVTNAQRRQVGSVSGEVTQALREELAGLSLREAVTRVAEDQMASDIVNGSGFGTYMVKEIDGHPADWCGAFAHFCWRQPAAIKNVPNPFGDDSRVLWSPQRAIGWAMRNPERAVIIRYKGGDPGPNPVKGTVEWRDLGEGYALERGDIVLVRKIPTGGDAWRHVTQIDWVGESTLYTIDGNQGVGRCIKRRTYDINRKLSNGQLELAFLHVLV